MQQEEARQVVVGDERELLVQAHPGGLPLAGVGVARAELVRADARQRGLGRLAGMRSGEVGEAVAQVAGEVEPQPLGQARGLGHGLRVVGEQRRHLGRAAQHRVAVAAPLGLGAVEGRAVADRHEGVLQQRAPGGVRVGVARRHARHAGALGQPREVPRQAPVAPRAGVLDLHADVVRPEVAHQVAHRLLGLPAPPAAPPGAAPGPVARAAGEAHQPLGVGRQARRGRAPGGARGGRAAGGCPRGPG